MVCSARPEKEMVGGPGKSNRRSLHYPRLLLNAPESHEPQGKPVLPTLTQTSVGNDRLARFCVSGHLKVTQTS